MGCMHSAPKVEQAREKPGSKPVSSAPSLSKRSRKQYPEFTQEQLHAALAHYPPTLRVTAKHLLPSNGRIGPLMERWDHEMLYKAGVQNHMDRDKLLDLRDHLMEICLLGKSSRKSLSTTSTSRASAEEDHLEHSADGDALSVISEGRESLSVAASLRNADTLPTPEEMQKWVQLPSIPAAGSVAGEESGADSRDISPQDSTVFPSPRRTQQGSTVNPQAAASTASDLAEAADLALASHQCQSSPNVTVTAVAVYDSDTGTCNLHPTTNTTCQPASDKALDVDEVDLLESSAPGRALHKSSSLSDTQERNGTILRASVISEPIDSIAKGSIDSVKSYQSAHSVQSNRTDIVGSLNVVVENVALAAEPLSARKAQLVSPFSSFANAAALR